MTDYRVQTKRLPAQGEGVPVLLGFGPSGHVADWVLAGSSLTMGRVGHGATIAIACPVVSASHGLFSLGGGRITYRDVGSTNGTLLNGTSCTGEVTLRDGDILSICPRRSPRTPAFKLVLAYVRQGGFRWHRLDLTSEVGEVRIGRGEGGMDVTDEFVSRRHVAFLPRGRDLYVFDLSSTNGVTVDGRRIKEGTVVPQLGIVRFGNTWACHAGSSLWIGTELQAARAVAETPSEPMRGPSRQPASLRSRLRQQGALRGQAAPQGAPPAQPAPRVSGPVLHIDIQQKAVGAAGTRRVLLEDVRADIQTGDFVLVLGGSGAGKSTFLKAVMGYDRADGHILYGDVDVYDEYDRIKYDIGYVPQENLVRRDDTVFDTLVSAARLRLAPHLAREQYEQAACRVERELGLEAVSDNLVGNVSGGQLRRVCIGCELVGNPSLLFLDEPDSGLDEPVARGIRRDLRHVADAGKIVMVVTHSPDIESELFTKVLVIAKCSDGVGHLLFCGAPADAGRFFGVRALSDIVARVNSPEENGDGLSDEFLRKWRSARHG